MSNPTMRAKMRVTKVEKFESPPGVVTQEAVSFAAVAKSGMYPEDGSDEDNTYAKYTPTADAKFWIANPALFGKFEADQVFYVDFVKAGG